jgi:hypothetical protein
MLFWLLLIGLFAVPLIIASVASGGFNASEETSSAVGGASMIIWLVISIFWLFGAAFGAADDPDLKHIDSVKTYMLVENSSAVYDNGTLEFSYTENGQVKPYREPVSSFAVPMEKPKGFKITKYHVTGGTVTPWDVDSGTLVEIIKDTK